MNVHEQTILQKLMKKYQQNYEVQLESPVASDRCHQAMARDIKINVHQQTAAQLKKRIELLKQLQSL